MQPPSSLAGRLSAASSAEAEPDSDVALLAQIRAGHSEAWDLLINRYQRLVYSVALRAGLGPEDAVDVTQSTFLILLESSETLRHDERLAGWLVTVARRQSWRLRQRRRHEVLAAQVDADEPEDHLDWDQLATLHSALHQLGSPCRELISALYLEADEPTYAQIARRLGRSIGGIGPLRGRCLARLRSLMKDDA